MRVVAIGLVLLICCLAGCATTQTGIQLQGTPQSASWPASPETPRIRHLLTIKGPQDVLPKERSNWQQLLEVLTGDETPVIDLVTPYGVAVSDAVVYVADSTTRLVHRYDLNRREVSYLASAGNEPLLSPIGIAVASSGDVYLTDSLAAKVYRYDSRGLFLGELPPPPGGFKRPAGIAVTNRDEKLVVDVLAHKLYFYDKADSFVRVFAGDPGQAPLNYPTNVAVDRNNNVYVSDSMQYRVLVLDQAGKEVSHFGQIGDSPGSFARMKGLAVDSDQNIYVVDAEFDNVQIFNRQGQLLLYLGRNGDNPGEFYLPSGIYIDKLDRIYVADTYNHRIQIFQYLKEDVRR